MKSKVNWLIEDQVFEENMDEIKKILKSLKVNFEVCNYVPFDGNQQFLKLFKKNDCVVFYGSLQFAKILHKESPWIPGAYYDMPKYECLNYYPKLGNFLLNEDYVMLPFGDLIRKRGWLLEHLGSNDCLFVRPSNGHKLFTGTVIEKKTWKKDVDRCGFYNVSPETLVVASSPKNIKNEWRLVIHKNSVVASTLYKSEGKSVKIEGATPEVLEYVKDVLDKTKFCPESLWTLDICQKTDDEIKVLEIGCFSCSGLYGCNLKVVIEKVNEVAYSEWSDYINDQKI